ncbi:tyrosine-protein phosphatase [Natronoglycomyces albus]|uniref:Tyrosine-protein phosphatase n=1 Tax=Natronoglycomyces albus TaxID=2811108 RepID=A0A895XMR4_9ACTN|nr:tyrosine-protein phosphatase [Natronoglycomyces albus]QSB06417.1 tyrosine-protein phosphatase [Natronoglycomyces albus]
MTQTQSQLPAQFIPTTRIFNLRDLGGYRGVDGCPVKKDVVFRSDNFGNATEADLDHVVNELKVRHVIDLRRAEELEVAPRFPATEGISFHHEELKHLRWESFNGIIPEPAQSHERSVAFLSQRYMAMLETGHEAVRRSLEIVANGEPTVFHCMAGKDRTGIIAAVLLGLLGVSDEDIAADYALTDVGTARWRAWRDQGNPTVAKSYMGTPAEAMSQTIQMLRDRFGSFHGYCQVIGFSDIDRLREELLCP